MTTEARVPKAHALQEKPLQWKAQALESIPHLPQLEKVHAQQQKTQGNQK